jgi:tetratricopeptide (TPR) repeat protein
LETIVLKAIARSPESRYKSAEDFADDLRRFRDDQPIRARRIGPVERLSRWSRRNPALAGMSLALALCTVLSFAAISWNWRQAVQEKQNAETEGARAESNLTLALSSMDRLLERFESDWMSHPLAPDSSTGESETQLRFVVSEHSAAVLEEALVFYDQFAEQNANNPKLERDTAKAYRRVGDILERLGRYDEAEQAYRRSADTLGKLIDQADQIQADDAELIAETAAVLNRLALVLHRV